MLSKLWNIANTEVTTIITTILNTVININITIKWHLFWTHFKYIINNHCIFQSSISLTSSYNRHPLLAVVRQLDLNFLQIIFSQGTCAKGCQHIHSSSSCNPSDSYVKIFLQSAQFPLLRTLRTRAISYFSELSVRILVSCSLIIHMTQLPIFSSDSNPKPWF